MQLNTVQPLRDLDPEKQMAVQQARLQPRQR